MRRISLLIVAALLFTSGCATEAVIRTNWDKDTDFAVYKTYRFAEVLSTNRGQEYDTLATKYLRAAVSRELLARGYKEGGAEANLEVNFHLYLMKKQEITSTTAPSGGYYGYRRGYYGTWGGYGSTVDVKEYTEGTLHLDLIDNARDQLVWEGVAVGEVTDKDMEKAEEGLNHVVQRIFKQYPFTAGKGQ